MIDKMRIAKFFILASLLVAAAACAPKPQEASCPSALDVIFARKSVRSYTDQPVSDEQVETMLRAAMAAPTGMNVQPWRFVVIRDQAVKEKLAGPRGGMIAQAPVVFVICGETTLMRKPFGQPDAEAVEVENGNWTQDCSAATENLLLAAEALGLGAVWTAAHPYADRVNPIREALGLPENVTPLCVVPCGYPAGDDQPKDKWKPENIHYDKW
jgi:nitroreductase